MQDKLKSIFTSLEGVDGRSAQFLAEALTKNNLQGFDYLEYKQSVEALANLNLDERTAFISSYATASTMGLTKGKLLETANFYQKILQQEQNKFEQALQAQTKRQIAGKMQETENHKKAMLQKEEAIKRLQQEIDKHQVAVEEAEGHIDAAKRKIFAAKENFETTYQKISGEINDDVEKIKMYL